MYKKVSKTCIKVVKDNLKEKLKDGIKVGSNIINVNSISRNEFTKSENSQYYEKYNNKKYEDKFKATNYADEILNASRNYVNEDLKHLRKDNITQFARETVLLKVGDNDYSADFVVGYTSGTT